MDSILIRIGEMGGRVVHNLQVHQINGAIGVNVQDNALIIGQWFPDKYDAQRSMVSYARSYETEVYCFRDADLAFEASEIIDKAIKDKVDEVNLLIKDGTIEITTHAALMELITITETL